MNIYSDILTDHDLTEAVRATNQHSALDHGTIGFERFRRLVGPRIRTRGWDVLLYRYGSRMHFNTGTHGAGCEGAASWNDWGAFLAVLFQRDPKLRAAYYDGYAQFHENTGHKYEEISGWGESGKSYRDDHGAASADFAVDGGCGRAWNDALITSRTPAPSARCPYEGEHEEMGVSYACD